jgi:DHA2 family multidrug resistance protein
MGLLGFCMVRRLIFDPGYVRSARPGRIDALGFGLLTVWLGTMQTVLDKGQDADWFGSTWIRWFSLVSAAAFIGFVVWELRTREPIAALRVFKDRNFGVGTVLISVAAVLAYGPMTLLPLFLQGLMGYTSLQSGITQMSRGLGSVLAMPVVGYIIGKLDDRKTIGVGFFVTGLSAMMLGSLNLFFAPQQIFWPNFLQGVGISLCMVPLMTVAMGTLSNEQMGNATGLFALARNLAASIGISMVTTVATRAAQTHQAILVAHVTPYDPAFQNVVQAGQAGLAGQLGAAQAQSGALALVYQQLLQQSNLLAYLDDFRWLGVLCFIALPLVVLLKRVAVKGAIAVH